MKRLISLATALLAGPLLSQDAALTLPGIDGKTYEPLNPGGKKAVVIFFVSPYCSTSNTFAPEMNAIAADFGEGFAFRFVHSDNAAKAADVLQHAELMAFKSPVLLDAKQDLAKKLGARITPEVAVLSPDGKTLYQGRINDLYKGPTRRQREASTRDLRDALEAIRDGKAVAQPKTDAVGCDIGGMKAK